MNKEIIIQKVQKKLAGIKDYRYEPTNVRSPNAIWFQKQDDMNASVTRVYNNTKKRDEYIFSILNGYGKVIEEGKELTLPLAKKKVFKFFDTESKN